MFAWHKRTTCCILLFKKSALAIHVIYLLQEYQSFTDLRYSKDKTSTCVRWHPEIKGDLGVQLTAVDLVSIWLYHPKTIKMLIFVYSIVSINPNCIWHSLLYVKESIGHCTSETSALLPLPNRWIWISICTRFLQAGWNSQAGSNHSHAVICSNCFTCIRTFPDHLHLSLVFKSFDLHFASQARMMPSRIPNRISGP